MNYWLIKIKPNEYSWDDLVQLGHDHWDDVCNYEARKCLSVMEHLILCFFTIALMKCE